jgi:hypothetical protein
MSGRQSTTSDPIAVVRVASAMTRVRVIDGGDVADRDQRAGLVIPASLAGCRHGVAACALGDHARGTAPVRKEAIFERLKALWDAAGAALGLVSAARLIACGFLGGFAMLSPHPGGQHFII